MDKNVVRISFLGSFIAVFFMVFFYFIVIFFDPLIPFEFFSVSSLLSFLFVGAFQMRLVKEVERTRPNDMVVFVIAVTPFLTLLWVAFLIVIADILRNGFQGANGVLDILGFLTVITPFWLLGTPVMVVILFIGTMITPTKKRIVALVIILLGLGYVSYIGNPDIDPATEYSISKGIITDFCPSNLEPIFNIGFVNNGKAEVELCMNVWSDEINFIESFRCTFIPPDRKIHLYEFEIDSDSLPDYEAGLRASVYYTGKYKRYMILPMNDGAYCRYARTDNASDYRLVDKGRRKGDY